MATSTNPTTIADKLFSLIDSIRESLVYPEHTIALSDDPEERNQFFLKNVNKLNPPPTTDFEIRYAAVYYTRHTMVQIFDILFGFLAGAILIEGVKAQSIFWVLVGLVLVAIAITSYQAERKKISESESRIRIRKPIPLGEFIQPFRLGSEENYLSIEITFVIPEYQITNDIKKHFTRVAGIALNTFPQKSGTSQEIKEWLALPLAKLYYELGLRYLETHVTWNPQKSKPSQSQSSSPSKSSPYYRTDDEE